MKSDLRQEMDVRARLAAAEAVQHAGGHGASIMHTEQCECERLPCVAHA